MYISSFLLFVMNGMMSHFLLQGIHQGELSVSQLSLYFWSVNNSVPLEKWDPTPN